MVPKICLYLSTSGQKTGDLCLFCQILSLGENESRFLHCHSRLFDEHIRHTNLIPIGLISCYSLDHYIISHLEKIHHGPKASSYQQISAHFSSRNHVDGHTCMHECRMNMARKLLESFYLLLKNFLCNRGSLRSFRNDKTMLQL